MSQVFEFPPVELTVVAAKEEKKAAIDPLKDKLEEQPATKEEIARFEKFYPHGFHFVDAIRYDDKILWNSKEIKDRKFVLKAQLFKTVDEFQREFLKARADKRASIDVRLPAVNPELLGEAYKRGRTILEFLRDKGYDKAGGVSN